MCCCCQLTTLPCHRVHAAKRLHPDRLQLLLELECGDTDRIMAALRQLSVATSTRSSPFDLAKFPGNATKLCQHVLWRRRSHAHTRCAGLLDALATLLSNCDVVVRVNTLEARRNKRRRAVAATQQRALQAEQQGRWGGRAAVTNNEGTPFHSHIGFHLQA